MTDFIAEDQIEQALSQKRLHVHGYDVPVCGTEEHEVILLDRLRAAAVANAPERSTA